MSLHTMPEAHRNAERYDPEELRRKVVEGGSAELARSSAKPSSPDPRIEDERLRQLEDFKARYGS